MSASRAGRKTGGARAAPVACQDPVSRPTLEAISRKIKDAVSAGHSVIVIDLGAVTCIDNETLAELCVTLQRFAGTRLRIEGADSRVRWVLANSAIDGLELAPAAADARPLADPVQWLRARWRRALARQADVNGAPSRSLS